MARLEDMENRNMDVLKQRILLEGKNLGHGILKIDSFLNHQIDALLMEQVGQAIADQFAYTNRILVVDDFLTSWHTIDALARIVESSGATLLGITAVVEKIFEGGRDLLAHWQVPIVAMATITDMRDGRIELA
jgi:adenine/guanine phosphoribosyltransferase-like PRPP-binding protein